MKILLASEVFPPRSGGAGWSTRALALALRSAGHEVRIATTSPGPPVQDGVEVERLAAPGKRRFAHPRAFAREARRLGDWIVHAQHSLSALGCLAARPKGRVAVTVRDFWPVCFWSTRISRGALCPACGLVPMTRCVEGRVFPRALSYGAIPYMRWDLGAKRSALLRAGAILAVSEAIAEGLSAFPRVETIPNIVDAEETREVGRLAPSFALPEKFLLFIGKLEENKGARLLIPAVSASGTRLPLVILGEGSLAKSLKFDAAAKGVSLIVRGWAEREDVLRAMARATILVFPSLWPEPLSRVLLEALALGTPIAAMDTGGTREILRDGESGLLTRDVAGLAEAIARLEASAPLRAQLGEGARERARAFSPEFLLPRYEAVYRRLS